MFRKPQPKTYYTRNGNAVVFHPSWLTVNVLEKLPPGYMVVEPAVSNSLVHYKYYLKLADGSVYSGNFDHMKNVKEWPLFRKPESSWDQGYAPYKYWTEDDFNRVSEVVEERAQLLSQHRKIKIIDAQYINYSELQKKFNVSGNNFVRRYTNDEWFKVRDAFRVVDLIDELEEDYLLNQKLNLNIVRKLLEQDYIKNAEQNNTHAIFWISLRHRLSHLLNHPEDAKKFEVVAHSEGACISGSKYIDPVAVVALVEPSDEDFVNSDLVRQIKQNPANFIDSRVDCKFNR
jgi:hypothetical protein